MKCLFRLLASLVIVSALGGCVTPPEAPVEPAPPPPPPVVQKSAGELDLEAALEIYNAGDYPAAIKKIEESVAIWADKTEIQTAALKYLAFSNCVLNRRTPCRQHFDRALRIDPAFDLAAAETGHPQWGPVFRQAKAAAAARSSAK